MLNILFFVKVIIVTVLVASLLQFKVSGITLETHATRFVTTSIVTEPIRYVAQAGSRVIRDGANWISERVNTKLGRNKKPPEKAEVRPGTFRWTGGDGRQQEGKRSGAFRWTGSQSAEDEQGR